MQAEVITSLTSSCSWYRNHARRSVSRGRPTRNSTPGHSGGQACTFCDARHVEVTWRFLATALLQLLNGPFVVPRTCGPGCDLRAGQQHLRLCSTSKQRFPGMLSSCHPYPGRMFQGMRQIFADISDML